MRRKVVHANNDGKDLIVLVVEQTTNGGTCHSRAGHVQLFCDYHHGDDGYYHHCCCFFLVFLLAAARISYPRAILSPLALCVTGVHYRLLLSADTRGRRLR